MMMEIAYGHRVVSDDDTYLRLVDEAIRVILDSGNIGLSIVDVFPFCVSRLFSPSRLHHWQSL